MPRSTITQDAELHALQGLESMSAMEDWTTLLMGPQPYQVEVPVGDGTFHTVQVTPR